ncbi:hypothetical protein SUGI_0915970 [Cryptomeria japonica]|nr:hypothetical protein SUGI_0915970 [Cryptomeria japonica]
MEGGLITSYNLQQDNLSYKRPNCNFSNHKGELTTQHSENNEWQQVKSRKTKRLERQTRQSDEIPRRNILTTSNRRGTKNFPNHQKGYKTNFESHNKFQALRQTRPWRKVDCQYDNDGKGNPTRSKTNVFERGKGPFNSQSSFRQPQRMMDRSNRGDYIAFAVDQKEPTERWNRLIRKKCPPHNLPRIGNINITFNQEQGGFFIDNHTIVDFEGGDNVFPPVERAPSKHFEGDSNSSVKNIEASSHHQEEVDRVDEVNLQIEEVQDGKEEGEIEEVEETEIPIELEVTYNLLGFNSTLEEATDSEEEDNAKLVAEKQRLTKELLEMDAQESEVLRLETREGSPNPMDGNKMGQRLGLDQNCPNKVTPDCGNTSKRREDYGIEAGVGDGQNVCIIKCPLLVIRDRAAFESRRASIQRNVDFLFKWLRLKKALENRIWWVNYLKSKGFEILKSFSEAELDKI